MPVVAAVSVAALLVAVGPVQQLLCQPSAWQASFGSPPSNLDAAFAAAAATSATTLLNPSPAPAMSAAATAIVSTAGTISAIHITNAGAGYTTVPTIAIAPPAASDASGNFQFNEIITGRTSGATERVRDWNSVTS